ncbi:unnamed protein product [Mesocestoides corti]|uniref:Rab-GAP TBC domain-containing protein n=1 Tax=Mesocestoides corti TaxID=53468 RepID=A0A158QVX3_MESCO|nr:unnamed protein product [Mesocestoides corti]
MCHEITQYLRMSYLAVDKYGEQSYYPLQSDIDLEEALIRCPDSTLRLFIEAKPRTEEDWDIVEKDEVAASRIEGTKLQQDGSMTEQQNSSAPKWSPPISPTHLASSIRSVLVGSNFLQNVSQQIGKTVTSIEKAIGLKIPATPPRPPICDAEFRQYMDNLGRIVHPTEFYRNVYLGGIEPSLRKVAWRILLNVYPVEVTGKERIALLHSKVAKYESMKVAWKRAYHEGRLSKAQIDAIALASVDVVRTDRTHPFYKCDDKNLRVSQLFNILATYAIYHPGIGYHQGMSNLASPLLYIQDSEGAAYVCFCALMRRLGPKFTPHVDQLTMFTQLQHLHDLLVFTDYEMAQFLRLHNLGNMFFTERWLLLELVREFSFEQALYVSEVQWAALALVCSTWPSVDPVSLYHQNGHNQLSEELATVVFEDSAKHYTRCDTKLINSLVGEEFLYKLPCASPGTTIASASCSPPTEAKRVSRPAHEGDPVHMKDWVVELPAPDVLGGGNNPFLLFVCVSMLLEYKDEILAEVREPSDLFHFFQTRNKRHNPVSILNRARCLFDAYLRQQEARRRELAEGPRMQHL